MRKFNIFKNIKIEKVILRRFSPKPQQNFLEKVLGRRNVIKEVPQVKKEMTIPSQVSNSLQTEKKMLGSEEIKEEKTGKPWGTENPYANENAKFLLAKPIKCADPWDTSKFILNSPDAVIKKHKEFLHNSNSTVNEKGEIIHMPQKLESVQEFMEAYKNGTLNTEEFQKRIFTPGSKHFLDFPEGYKIVKMDDATKSNKKDPSLLPENLGAKPSATVPPHYGIAVKNPHTKAVEIIILTHKQIIKHKLTDTFYQIHDIEVLKIADKDIYGEKRDQNMANYSVVPSENTVVAIHKPELETPDNLITGYFANMTYRVGKIDPKDPTTRKVVTQVLNKNINDDSVESKVYTTYTKEESTKPDNE